MCAEIRAAAPKSGMGIGTEIGDLDANQPKFQS